MENWEKGNRAVANAIKFFTERGFAISIPQAVENGYSQDFSDFYYGYEDGQISVYEVKKEITVNDQAAKGAI